MHDWRDRCVSLEVAVGVVKPGAHVFVGSACATPRAFMMALDKPLTAPAGVQAIHFLTDGSVPRRGESLGTSLHHRIFFVGNDMREVLTSGRVEYIPVSLSEVPQMIRSGRLTIDVAVVQVTPPDDSGMCSLGVSVDIAPAAIEAADVLIAEINPNMPRTIGPSTIHIDRFDHLVEVDSPVIEYAHAAIGDAARTIAGYVARLVDDGSTLQIGMGRVPNEMLRFLTNRKDLGIHSDVISEAVVDLVESGVVNGARKTLHPNKVVTSWCMGTRRLYDLIDGDDRFLFLPIDEVCDPAAIAANDNLVSVTQAFAMDLTGQVCADSLGGKLYGGVSTQPEFHRGALRSNGGRAIICLTSTQPDGTPAIKPSLDPHEAVAIPRSEVHWVVTEFGTAHLFGRSLRERAVSMIEIAHPDHREGLLEAAIDAGLLPEKQRLRSRIAYPAGEEREEALRNGVSVRVRPAITSDAPRLQDLFFRLRPEDVYTRFFRKLDSLPLDKAEHLCSVGYETEMSFVAVVGDMEDEKVIGTSSYFVDESTKLADVAYIVDPEWQGVGLGRLLQDRTVSYAREHGVLGFTADVLTENKAMMAVMQRADCELRTKIEYGAYQVTMLFK